MNYKRLLYFSFFIAVLLRISLSFFNFQAPDDHLEIARMIQDEGKLPAKDDCWEGFQPKLYHSCLAAIFKAFGVGNGWDQILIAQFLNCIAGILTIYIVWIFLKGRSLSDRVKFFAFSMIALNPELIGINTQATNDSFVILFSTAAIYYAYLFFSIGRLRHFLRMTVFTILAGLSKGNGLVIFFALFLIFSIKIIAGKEPFLKRRKNYLSYLIIFALVFLAIVPLAGQYWHNYRHYGSPFVTNLEKQPLPHLAKRTFYSYPGVTSVLDSYFTFRLLDLIQYPMIAYGNTWYPLSRTSLWTYMYGGVHFIYYDISPTGWFTTDPLILNIGRVIFLLAIFLTAILLYAVIANLFLCLKAMFKHRSDIFLDTNDWIFTVFLLGYLCFIIVYSLRIREFGAMKAIFVFPAILPVAGLFSEGLTVFYKTFDDRRSMAFLLDLVFFALLALYCFTVLTLIHKFFKIFLSALSIIQRSVS